MNHRGGVTTEAEPPWCFFGGERVLYELSLQDAMAAYAGDDDQVRTRGGGRAWVWWWCVCVVNRQFVSVSSYGAQHPATVRAASSATAASRHGRRARSPVGRCTRPTRAALSRATVARTCACDGVRGRRAGASRRCAGPPRAERRYDARRRSGNESKRNRRTETKPCREFFYSDAAWSLSMMSTSLERGVDCPDDAHYLGATTWYAFGGASADDDGAGDAGALGSDPTAAADFYPTCGVGLRSVGLRIVGLRIVGLGVGASRWPPSRRSLRSPGVVLLLACWKESYVLARDRVASSFVPHRAASCARVGPPPPHHV